VTDEEWAFCVGYLTLMTEKVPQRDYPLREIFNALRYLIRAGGAWRVAARFAAVACDLPTDPTMAKSGMF
jgi:transposase